MCKEKIYQVLYLVVVLWCCAWGVLQAEEPDPWYLIQESELRTIGRYKEKSEVEKQTLLLQVQKLQGTAASLRENSGNLNRQLGEARAAQRKLEKLFNEYEADRLARLSLKNGEIAGLKKDLADQKAETAAEKVKTQKARILNVILGGILAVIGVVLAVKMYRGLRRPP